MIPTSFVILAVLADAGGMACFQCVSVNGSEPGCEDPFSNIPDSLMSPCTTTWKRRQGAFPSSACIKMAGVVAQTGAAFVVRTCSVDSASLTSDTELARSNHCGSFVFDDQLIYGCVKACDSYDGCNAGHPVGSRGWATLLLLLLPLTVTSVV